MYIAEIGIKDNLVRMACGIEDYEDIESDIAQALEQIALVETWDEYIDGNGEMAKEILGKK